MTRALLSMAATLLQTHHNHQTCYGRAKKAANATGANFVKNSLAEAAESGYMHDIGSRTLEVLESIRAELALPERKPMPEVDMNDLAFQCGIQREDARDPGVEEFARAIEAFHGIREDTNA